MKSIEFLGMAIILFSLQFFLGGFQVIWNIPAFFWSNFFLATAPGTSCILLGLDGGTVIDEGALLQQVIFIKTLGFRERKAPRNGAWRYQNSDTTDVSRKQTRVDRARRLDANKNQRSGCVFSQQGLSPYQDFTRFQQMSPLCDHHKDSFGGVKWTFHQKDHGIGPV